MIVKKLDVFLFVFFSSLQAITPREFIYKDTNVKQCMRKFENPYSLLVQQQLKKSQNEKDYD